ncbi:pentapeptide repeat-containing protein [Brevibacillus laterosporus]|uniref:pentapeptide repeat-containing protein n=1 Tax=Brevibacillus laterosporus TaxID=1465 RepID=UPI000839BA90|nr:pentapeptide repeat-containing protein [Brevibacillus laterosporus]
MKYLNDDTITSKRGDHLRADCESCFGLCCVALCFSASDGFPINKDAGTPCIKLQKDFRCGIHESLSKRGLKGCIAFDCFGAGQKVSQVSFGGHDWQQAPESAKPMFKVFLIMLQIHELLWYLTEALMLQAALPIHDELRSVLEKTEKLTYLSPDELMNLDVAEHRAIVNTLLLKTSELVRAQARIKKKHRPEQKARSGRKKNIGRGADLIAADLRKTDLRGADLRGAYLIAADLRGTDLSGADLIGADFRDADLSGADLSKSIFLTQSQISSAKGDSRTKLPSSLTRPEHWVTI